MIQVGQTVTVVIGGTDYILQWRPLPVCDRVATELLSQPLAVRSCDIVTPSWLSTAAIGAVFTATYPYTGTWIVEARQDFAKADDIAALVANACYAATGLYPAEVGIYAIGNTQTGAPVPSPPTSTIDLGNTLSNVGSFLDNLSSSAWLIVIGLLALLVAVVLIVVSSPQGRTAALRLL